MVLKDRYMRAKQRLLTDQVICDANRKLFRKFLDFEEYKLKRTNGKPSVRAHPEVLLLRAEIYGKAGKWDLAAEIAETLTEKLPKEFAVWLLLADSFNSLGRTEEAYETLFSVTEQFFNEPEIHYRLAQYAAVLGHNKEAYEALCMAFEKSGDDPKLKLRALNDKALEPFWLDIQDVS